MGPHHHIGLQNGALIALLFGALILIRAVVAMLRKRRDGGRVRLSVPGLAITQSILVLTLWGCYAAGGWTAESVGISRSVAPWVAFLGGLWEFGLFVVAGGVVYQMFGNPLRYWRATLRVNAMFRPRGRSRRLIVALVAIVNPVTEELFFRGLLVHQLAYVGASLWVALAAGALVNAANHTYQGRWAALEHLVFYGCAVGLLYSPLGLVGAIGFHFGADVLPPILYARQLRAYRQARRAWRAQSQLQLRRP
jgi:membrane protease YdiL (CAAX protease family)